MVFVRDVMTRHVVMAEREESVLEAARRMASRKIGGLVIVEHGRPIGILTERDVVWKVTARTKDPKKVTVGEVMTTPAITVSPLTTLRAAARVMLQKKTRWLVVTRLEQCEGIITATDLTEGFLESFARATKRRSPP
jgi:CBS domain-containing protein